MKEYKLCYVRGNKAWFTDNIERQWGDDWNDKPYEHNAGEPYDDWYDEEGVIGEIKLKVLYFETNDWSEKQPCDGYLNSPYSVEEINRGKVPWLETDKYKIYAGTLYEDFIRIIEGNGGNIYIKKDKE